MAMHAATQEKRVANRATRETVQPDAAYLFACHLRWNQHGDLKAYFALVSALDSSNEEVQMIAESLLRRKSPRPRSCAQNALMATGAGQER